MPKINIVHILPTIKIGGAEVFTVELLKTLNKRRYYCSLITLFSPTSDNRLLQSVQKANIDYYALNKGLGFNPRTAYVLGCILRKLKPDIIHTHLYVMKYVLLACIGSHIPVWLHTMHSLAHQELVYADRNLARILYRLNKIKPVAVSHAVAKTFIDYYRISEATVIHNGIKCDDKKICTKYNYRENLSLPIRGTIIISLARLIPDKNHSLLIDSFKDIQMVCKDCYLVVVGDGPLRQELEQKVNQADLKEKVFFTGQVNNPESYLKAADVFALSSNREGLPISLLEAMRAGLPVVATRAGGVPEIVDHSVNGYLVNIGDTKGFATALLDIIKTKKCITFGQMARKKIFKEFNIESTTRKYESLYEGLLLL